MDMRFNEFMASTNTEYDPLIKLLSSLGLSTKGKAQPSRLEKIRHVRVTDPIAKIEQAIKKVQNVQIKKVGAPNQLSSAYEYLEVSFPEQLSDIYPDLAGKEFNVVSAIKSGRTVAIKAFTPVNLGLAGQTFGRDELYSILGNKIKTDINDPGLKELLSQLLDVAVGLKDAVDKDIMDSVTADLKQLGTDYGEILGPLMAGEDNIVFPAGNSMLADVEIDGKSISIKSGAGSGTSFKAILPHLDKFKEAGLEDLDEDEIQINKFYRAFVDTDGTNNDKIIAGSNVAQTKEHLALAELIGNVKITQADLEKYAESFGKDGYSNFLKAIYPVSIAGGYNRPQGLPQDSYYYMGMTDKKPVAKQAGKPFWDAKGPGIAGRNIMIYILAASFLKASKAIEVAEKHNKFLSRILSKTDAELMWVDIKSDGTISLKREPIASAKVVFQYHAPSHIPGNNLPGVSLKLN